MIVSHDYDLIPQDQLVGLRLSGWSERVVDGVTQRTDVRRKAYWKSVEATALALMEEEEDDDLLLLA